MEEKVFELYRTLGISQDKWPVYTTPDKFAEYLNSLYETPDEFVYASNTTNNNYVVDINTGFVKV